MKGSTFALIVALWTCVVGSVIILAPGAMLSTVQKSVGNVSPVQVIVAIWIVVTISVVARPRSSGLFAESIVRATAWLILFKCLFAFCWPGLVSWSLKFYNQFPVLLRCGGLINILIGLWFFSLYSHTKNPPAADPACEGD